MSFLTHHRLRRRPVRRRLRPRGQVGVRRPGGVWSGRVCRRIWRQRRWDRRPERREHRRALRGLPGSRCSAHLRTGAVLRWSRPFSG